MSAEFAITAFRAFHSLVPPTIEFVDVRNVKSEMRLSDSYFRSDILRTKYSALLRGLSRQKIRINELGYVDEVRFKYLAIGF